MPAKSLAILDTDPLALIALGFLVAIILASIGLFAFILTRKSTNT